MKRLVLFLAISVCLFSLAVYAGGDEWDLDPNHDPDDKDHFVLPDRDGKGSIIIVPDSAVQTCVQSTHKDCPQG